MELTPIRVRGKKPDKGEHALVRPSKRLKTGQGQKEPPKSRLPKASNIEKSLPLEVLERIFLLSENVNFPRANLRLGRILSGPYTLRSTFLTAFGPTWDVWFGCVNGSQDTNFPVVQGYADWETDTSRFGGNPSFQTDIIACSWATIDMILDCWDIWVRRHAQHRHYERFHLWGNPMTPSSYTDSGLAIGSSGIKEARYYFYHDYDAFRDIEKLKDDRVTKSYLPGHNKTWIEVHISTEIPDELITGPWSEKDLQKLFWLVQAGARLSPGQTWELTREGYRQAIPNLQDPNLTVIRLLHFLGAFQQWPDYIVQDEYQWIVDNAAANLEKSGHGTGSLSAAHARMAYRYINHVLSDR